MAKYTMYDITQLGTTVGTCTSSSYMLYTCTLTAIVRLLLPLSVQRPELTRWSSGDGGQRERSGTWKRVCIARGCNWSCGRREGEREGGIERKMITPEIKSTWKVCNPRL